MVTFDFLIDDYPKSLTIDGIDVLIDSDFKTIIKIINVLETPIYSFFEKQMIAINAFYPSLKNISNPILCFDEMIRFIHLYRDEKNEDDNQKVFDFTKDSGRILAAFIQCYNIDLSTINMHWFKFYTLLENISDSKPQLLQVMELRATKITNAMDAEQRIALRKAKKRISLDDIDTDELNIGDTIFKAIKQ